MYTDKEGYVHTTGAVCPGCEVKYARTSETLVQMIRLEWTDSGMHIDKGWATADEYRENTTLDSMKVVTVGILVSEDGDSVLVALSKDPAHDTYQGMQLIAKSNILSRREL